MSRIPSTYEHADRLGADGRAMCALGWSTWEGLTAAQRRAITDARKFVGGLALDMHATLGTSRALAAMGLVVWSGERWELTGRGHMVREAGTRTAKGQDHD